MSDDELFELLKNSSASVRDELLDRHAGDDSARRARLWARILEAACAGTGEIENRAGEAAPPSTHIEAAETVGRSLGKYTLERSLGEGGMGSVWIARQSEPVKRRVALKLIKPGMDSRAVLRRFEAERQALAVMDHPNIARVYDGGLLPDGRPYFAMELVVGEPLIDYCDRQRLGTPDRLGIFVKVCQAVQHAHLKGVIHRDLKPANILVTAVDGRHEPKVIDFGVAKAVGGKLHDRAETTQIGALIGTLEYMAPEQAAFSGADVDTRADVYALGVILYELLTGLRPFDSQRLRRAALDEVIRIIREEEPTKPSTRLNSSESLSSAAAVRHSDPKKLVNRLRGDLDWIAMKCLEKDRTRRYETANALAADVMRHLADEPVSASPPGAAYRLTKFVRRHRSAVAAGTLLLLALVAGIAGTGWGLAQARDQRTVALAALGDAVTAKADAEKAATNEAKAAKRALDEKQRADERAEDARRALYASRLQAASNAWRDNRTDLLRALLDRQTPSDGRSDLRGFEYGHLSLLADEPGPRWQQRGAAVFGLALSPDERRAISASGHGHTRGKGIATCWDVATGKPLWNTGGEIEASVNAAAFSPDGKTVALAGHFGQLQLWSIDGKKLRTLAGHKSQVFGAAFSPDGNTLASVSADMTVRLWNAATGEPLDPNDKASSEPAGRQGVRQVTDPAKSIEHTNMIWGVAWSPTGDRLATASSDGSIKIWRKEKRELLATLTGHSGLAVSVAWSPDGKHLVSASRPIAGDAAGEAILWSVKTAKPVATMRAGAAAFDAAVFTPDGLHVVTGCSDRTLRAWRKDGSQAAILHGFRGRVQSLAIGGGGRWAIAGTGAGEVVRMELQRTPARQQLPASMFASIDVTKAGELRTLSSNTELTFAGHELAVSHSAPRSDLGRNRVFADALVYAVRNDGADAYPEHPFNGAAKIVWRNPDRTVRHTLEGHPITIAAMTFLENDRLASADATGRASIWNGADGKMAHSFQVGGGVLALTAHRDGGAVLVGGKSGAGWMTFWEPSGVRWTREASAIVRAAVVDPGKSVAIVGCDDGQVLRVSLADGKSTTWISIGSAVMALARSPTEPRLAIAGSDGSVRLFDDASGEEVLTFDKINGEPRGLAFFPDGKRLAVLLRRFPEPSSIQVFDSRPRAAPEKVRGKDAQWLTQRLESLRELRADDLFAERWLLDRLIALEPDKSERQLQRVAVDLRAGQFAAAAERLEDMVRRWPDRAEFWYDLANARAKSNDDAGAEEAYKKCIDLQPSMAEAHCNYGEFLAQRGRLKEALAENERGHELGMAQKRAGKPWRYPSEKWVAHRKAMLELSKKHLGEDGQKPVGEVPDSERAAVVELLSNAGRPVAALRVSEKAGAVDPYDPTAMTAAVRAGLGLGDAQTLPEDQRREIRVRALNWLRKDCERCAKQDGEAAALRNFRQHHGVRLSRRFLDADIPEAERAAWRLFWKTLDDAVAE